MFLAPSAWLMLCSAVWGSSWPQVSYKSENFTVPKLEITRTGKTDSSYLFFGTIEAAAHAQKPLIMKDNNDLVWAGPSGTAPHNFKVQQYRGEQVLTYFTGEENPYGHGYGQVAILDKSYERIATISLKNSPSHRFLTPKKLTPKELDKMHFIDYHESFITSRGTMLVPAFNVTNYDLRKWGGPKNGWIFDWLFFDIDIETNKVLYQWSALEHVDPAHSHYINPKDGSLNFEGRNFGASQSAPWDFFHGNSVSEVPGGYLVDSRMTFSFYWVEAHTGKVKWTLEGSKGGDFKLEDPVPQWSWQHMPRLVTDNYTPSKFQIHLFNNNDIRGSLLDSPRTPSSGILLNIDTDNMTANAARVLTTKQDPIYAVAQGSYQSLPKGHVLLGYGAKPFIDEFDANNELIYRAQFASTSGRVSHSYRAYKLSWKGYPKWQPKVVAENGHIYASWNGATEFDAWNFYAGETKKNMSLVGSRIHRKGFETHFRIKKSSSKYNYIMGEALHQGKVTSRSSPVSFK